MYNEYHEIVIHIRSFDKSKEGEHTTVYYPRVKNFSRVVNQEYTNDQKDAKELNSLIGVEKLVAELNFEAIKDDGGNICYVYNNHIADPNLDVFLSTFSKSERIQMAKDYVDGVETALGAFVQEFGAKEIRDYLDVCFPEKDTDV